MLYESKEILLSIALASIVLLFYLFYNVFIKREKIESKEVQSERKASAEVEQIVEEKPNGKVAAKKEKIVKAKPAKVRSNEQVFKHQLLAATLKAHSESIDGIDFSPNGKYLISCGEDRAIFLWKTKDLDNVSTMKPIRCNVEFDSAKKIRFSPDSRAFITLLNNENTIRVFKIAKKDDNSLYMTQAVADFPKQHKADIINIDISCNGNFIMTCSNDTIIKIWNIKGEVLDTIDTKLMNNGYAAISTCGRVVAACGFTPEVRAWQVCFDKTNNFAGVKRAFELKGHTAGVTHFSFNSDTTRMASVSKDKTWKIWDTNVQFDKGQDPICLITGQVDLLGRYLVALSPDAYAVAVASENNVAFYNSITGKLDSLIEGAFNGNIIEMAYDKENKYLAVAGDRNIKLFHNVAGFKAAIGDFQGKLKTAANQASKERFQNTIVDLKNRIETILSNEAQA